MFFCGLSDADLLQKCYRSKLKNVTYRTTLAGALLTQTAHYGFMRRPAFAFGADRISVVVPTNTFD